MRKNLGNIVKLLVGILISVYLIKFLFEDIDYTEMMSHVRNIDWYFMVIMIFLSGMSNVSRGLRWNILLNDQGIKTDRKGLIMGVFFSYFINILFPRAGELARCTSVSYKYGLPTDKLLGTVVLERVIDMLMLLLCIALVLFLDFDLFGGFFLERLASLKDLLSGNMTLLVGVISIGILGLTSLFLLRKKISFIEKILGFFKGVLQGLISLKTLNRKGLFLFHTVLIWCLYLGMTYIPFKAFTALSDYDIVKSLFVFILGGIGMTIPAPGGIGSYQYVVVLGMTTVLGTSSDVAGAYAFSVHTTLTLFTILMGVIASIYLFKGKKHESLRSN